MHSIVNEHQIFLIRYFPTLSCLHLLSEGGLGSQSMKVGSVTLLFKKKQIMKFIRNILSKMIF